MKFLTYSSASKSAASDSPASDSDAAERTLRLGVIASDGNVIDLSARMAGVSNLSDLLAQGRLDEAKEVAASTSESDISIDEITFERTLTNPGKIFCIGVNYGGRADEYADKSDASYPSVFVRFPEGFVGHNQPVQRPPESEQLDYEGEIVAVIGTGGRRITEAEALSHVAGYALGNEGTIRDWVRHAKFNVTQGKNWERSGSIGPWMVTPDEVGELESLQLRTHVNGELRQDDSPATMKYSVAYQIHYLSTFVTLTPGDIIFTGTPTGAGARFDPPRWLKPGDEVMVSVPGIGELRNLVVDEFPEGSDLTAPAPK